MARVVGSLVSVVSGPAPVPTGSGDPPGQDEAQPITPLPKFRLRTIQEAEAEDDMPPVGCDTEDEGSKKEKEAKD